VYELVLEILRRTPAPRHVVAATTVLRDGRRVIVCLRGEVDLLAVPEAWAAMEPVIVPRDTVVVDMADVSFIDSYRLNLLCERIRPSHPTVPSHPVGQRATAPTRLPVYSVRSPRAASGWKTASTAFPDRVEARCPVLSSALDGELGVHAARDVRRAAHRLRGTFTALLCGFHVLLRVRALRDEQATT
jgi:hypothetical protein